MIILNTKVVRSRALRKQNNKSYYQITVQDRNSAHQMLFRQLTHARTFWLCLPSFDCLRLYHVRVSTLPAQCNYRRKLFYVVLNFTYLTSIMIILCFCHGMVYWEIMCCRSASEEVVLLCSLYESSSHLFTWLKC